MYFVIGNILIFLTLTFDQGEGQTSADVNFRVTEGFANTFVGDLKNTSYLNNKFDESVLDNMEFNLLDSTMFKVADGIIRTNEDIDREQLCILKEECHVTLDVTYSGPQGQVGGFKVSIEIVDINDFIPVFDPDTVEVTFSEGSAPGTSRSLNLAVDLDSPQNGVKRYELASSASPFKLVTEQRSGLVPGFSSLRLVLEEDLDREDIASYQLYILAYDSIAEEDSARRGILTVTVQVGDDNDNAPSFTEEAYELDIAEDAEPIKSLLTIKARDDDMGENAEVSYAWGHKTASDFGQLFQIHDETGVVNLVGLLDYEEETEYSLQVVASDHGSEPKSATTDIIIHVIDRNDNRPQITITVFGTENAAKLTESTPVGDFVARVSVSDLDSGNNGDIICTLPHPSFTLQSDSQSDTESIFKVVTAQPLDREVQEVYALHITCTDQGEEQNQETKTLVVTVMDENDNRPELPRAQYVVYVYENNAIGDVLVRINATDKDAGANGEVSYEVSKGEITKLISIDEQTGVITAKTVFDYESIKEIKFDVVIKDGGSSPHIITTNVTIHIKDRNDEKPTFDKNDYTMNVLENNETHVFVGKVSASDKDGEPFNTFSYSIAEEYEDVPFYIHTETGDIFASNRFDRETKDFYLFVVKVTDENDPYFSSEANVIISIQDINDNAPRVIFPPETNNTFTISNQLPVGTAVLTVQVSDADLGLNANCTYRMQELAVDGKVAFVISESGTITTNMNFVDLDFRSFELVVYIQDRGSPPLSTSQKIVINVDQTFAAASDDQKSGGNLSIIIAVTIVSIVIVAVLIAAILLIKLRERRRKREGQNKNMEPYNIDSSDIIDNSKSPNDSQAEQGKTNQAYVIEPAGVPISYNPLPPESRSRSVSPDSLMYEMKLDKVKAQKQYLAAMTGVLDHDTSSSGSTDDSGRGPSEEGGEYILRHSPLNDSSDQVPNDTYAVPQKKSSIKQTSASSSSTATSQNTDSSKNQATAKPQGRIPPSYDSYIRRKASGRQKKVEFDLSEKEVQHPHYHSTGDLRSEISDLDAPDYYIGQTRKPADLEADRRDNYTPTPPSRPPKRQTYDDMGFVFVNHLKNKLEPVHTRSHSYQDLVPSKPQPPLPDSSSTTQLRNFDRSSKRTKNSDVAMASIVV